MSAELRKVRSWLRDLALRELGPEGAVLNARAELERRAHERDLLEALERRVPLGVPAEAA